MAPTSTALVKRPASALMPPPPPPKRIKRPQTVIDEDTYTSALSHIIARDFLPDMLETEAQQDFLDALDSRDADWIEDAGRRMQVAMTPRTERRRLNHDSAVKGLGSGIGGETPTGSQAAGWDTPTSTAGRTPQRKAAIQPGKPEVDLNMSLASFQAKYTSEDNESFNKVIDKQNLKRREKQPWLWTNNKLPSKQQIAQAAQQQRLLGLSAAQKNEDHVNDAQALIPASAELDARPSSITQKHSNPLNGLMFTPSDLQDTHPGLESRSDTAEKTSLAPPKSINHSGTRLQLSSTTTSDTSIPPSPSISAVDAAIAGRPHPGLRATPSISTAAASDDEDEDGSQTPRVNGYAFVDEDATPSELGLPPSPPSPNPTTTDTRSKSPTSLLNDLISSHCTGPNPFAIQPSSRRETLHHAMVEKQLASKRKTPSSSLSLGIQGNDTTPVGKTPTPRFASSPRVGALPRSKDGDAKARAMGNLTPAARMLWHSIGAKRGGEGGAAGAVGGGRGVGARVVGSTGKQGRTWTPTPVRGVKRAV